MDVESEMQEDMEEEPIDPRIQVLYAHIMYLATLLLTLQNCYIIEIISEIVFCFVPLIIEV